MNWSEQQREAIEKRNSNILVAAAAGSGKTAVLVERIIRMITEEGVSVDSLLVVTFTNAAASEMKEKIRIALTEKAMEDPSLRGQLDLLPRASISTFHAFALDVIRRFFHVTGLDPDFSLCDEAKSLILREEGMEALFAECFEKDDSDFIEFLDWYGSGKSMDKAKDLLDSVYTAVMALPDPFERLEEMVSSLETDVETFIGSDAGSILKSIIKSKMVRAKDIIGMGLGLLHDAGLEELYHKMMQDYDDHCYMVELAEKGKFDELAGIIGTYRATTLSTKKGSEEAAIYAELKDQVAEFRNAAKKERDSCKELIGSPLEEQIGEMRKLVPMAKTMGRLLKRYHEIYAGLKREEKVIDFTDVEHFCLEILRHEEVSEYYKEKFSYIYIDEYQDTSVLQEAIVDLLSGDDNLFMVGDVKQSIYKFRLAEPEIFQEKYERYQSSEDERSSKIDLNLNFRSKNVILDWINGHFQDLMEGYDDKAKLHHGLSEAREDLSPELVLVDTGASEEDDDELGKMKNTELEAMAVGWLIKENLGKEYFDVKSGEMKKITYRDIVILSRSVVNVAETYRQVMEEQGIPLFLDESEGYFDTVEIRVFTSLLLIIDNKYRDVAFITVLRSEIFGFSVSKLAEIRKETPKGSYVEAFVAMADRDTPLGRECRAVLEKLDEWRKLSGALPLAEFLWTLMQKSGYYIYAGAMPSGEQRQANLKYLIDRAEAYQDSGENSLYAFVGYLDKIAGKRVKMSQVKLLGEKDDVVRLMTIHKSKGLEFPLVIVSGLGKKLMYTDRSDRILFHKDVGLGMYLEDPLRGTENETLLYKIIHHKMKEEERQEHIRVLYVAMTRAREKLILTGVHPDVAGLKEEKDKGFTADNSYLEMLTDLPDLRMMGKGELFAEPETAEEEQRPEVVPSEETEKRVRELLDYSYGHENARNIRSKYSVTMLNSEGRDDEIPEIRKRPLFLEPGTGVDAAGIGTIYHLVMEKLDPTVCVDRGAEGIKEQIEGLVASGLLTEEEADLPDLSCIERFFASEIGARYVRAYEEGRLYREQTFDLKMDMDGENMMVQGIIDCFFEEEDGLVLMDYKTGRFDKGRQAEEEKRVRETYRQQLAIYSGALEEALGRPVKESYLYLFGPGVLVDMDQEV